MKLRTVILVMLLPCCSAFSATWDSDGTVQSIQSIHDKQAHDGDTITVPAGTYHWDAVLNITKGITLRGQTTVTGNAMDTNGFTVTDKSIILEESPPNAGSAVNVTLTPSQHFEITGLTIRGSTPTSGSSAGLNAWIALKTLTDEANYNTRIHHNHFDMIYRLCIAVVGAYYGVADHNQATIRGNRGGERFIYFSQSNAHGNAMFADYSWFGTDKFFFLEDCYIKLVSPRGFSDCTHGGMRLVVRHNHIINGSSGDHGTEGGNSRGQRAVESYDNLLEFPLRTGTASHGTRGGNKLAHDNAISGAGKIDTLGSLNFFRTFGGGSGGDWLVADGSSPWDKNATEPDGTYVDANPPRPAHVFASGTCTQDDPATTGYVGTLIDGDAHWKPNQWVGYSIHNIDRARGGYITANTATEIKFRRYTATDRGPVNAFKVGQKYQVHKVLKAIDVAGSGKGDLVVGKVNSKTGVASWLHVIQEPTISWNNKVLNNNTYVGFNCGAPFVREGPKDGTPGFDFYNLGGGFPADSTPSQVAGLLTAEVNGVQYSGTFTYPHPLTTGASLTPAATPTPTSTPAPKSTPTPTPGATPSASLSATSTPTPASTPKPSHRVTPTPEENPNAKKAAPRNPQKNETSITPPDMTNVVYGSDKKFNVFDFWKAKSDKPTPLVIFIHGGGFGGGDKGKVLTQLPLDQLLQAGVSCASIDYRRLNSTLGPRQIIYPTLFLDCARAVQFFRHKAKEWNLDPARFACSGGSAGSGMSLWIAFHKDLADLKSDDPVARESTRLNCVAVFDAQTSYDPRWIKEKLPGRAYQTPNIWQLVGINSPKFGSPVEQFDELFKTITPEKARLMEDCSPINHLTAEAPPVFVYYRGQPLKPRTDESDNIHQIGFGLRLKEKMDALKVECEIVGGWPKNPECTGPDKSDLEFLLRHFGMKQ